MIDLVTWQLDAAGLWRAPGRAGILGGAFTIGVTRPTVENTGVPGTVQLRTAAQAGLPTTLAGDVVIDDTFHAANASGGVLLIEGVDLFGFIKVRTGRPVTIRRSRIRGSSAITGATRTALIDCNHPNVGSLGSANVLVEDCTLIPDYPSEGIDGIVGHDYTARRCLVRNVVDHFGVFNSYRPNDPARVTIEGCYCADLAYFSPCSYQGDNRTHNDGVQIQGNSGIRIVGNVIHANASTTAGNGYDMSAPAPNSYAPSVTGQGIGVTPNVSAVTDLVIDRNWLDYGAQSVTIINTNYPATGITLTGNRFGRNQPLLTKAGATARRPVVLQPGVEVAGIGPSTAPDTTNGNVYDDNGAPITVYRQYEAASGSVASTLPATLPAIFA